jgi:hypothetical protein
VTFTFQRTRREPTKASVLLDQVKQTPGLTAVAYADLTGQPLNTVRDALYRAVCRGQLTAVTVTAEGDADRPRRGRPPLCYWPVESTEGVTGG